MGWLAPRLLSSMPLEAVTARRLRRMRDLRLRARLEAIGEAFTTGYRAALEEREPEGIDVRLARVDPERQGFAAEGIGMGLALLDGLIPGRRDRLERYSTGPGRRQAYMLQTGAGWALAHPLLSGRSLLSRLDPALGAMAFDGYGFLRAFFLPRRTLDRGRVPRWISGPARPAFDAGIGRRLWFLDADLERIVERAAAFREDRRTALWSGLGEACAFGGGRDDDAAATLRATAGPFLPAFAQGIAFAAETRERAGNPAAHTEHACRTVWKRGAAATAAIVREAGVALHGEGAEALETWRRRIRERFAADRRS
jgi:enediyne biosynthesis protein E3